MTKYHVHSWAAITGGTFAAIGATALLVRDAYHTGITLDHVLMPLLVGLTILVGHLAWQAATEWKLSALPLVALAVLGSAITVYETMGRRAESRDTKLATATKTVDDYAALVSNLDRANKLVTEAESWVANECRSGVGPKCRGVTFTRDQRRAHAEQLRRDVEAHKAPMPVDSKAETLAAAAPWFGLSATTTKQAVRTFEPFLLPLMFEFCAMVLFGFGVGHRKVEQKAEAPQALSFERQLSDAEIEELRRVLAGMRRPATNDELADAMDVSKGEASKRVQKAVEMGVVTRFKAGRFNQISLVA